RLRGSSIASASRFSDVRHAESPRFQDSYSKSRMESFMTSTSVPMSRWLSLSSLLFIFGCLGPLEANAARILFVVDSVMPDGRANNANDREVVDRLTSKGHVVT